MIRYIAVLLNILLIHNVRAMHYIKSDSLKLYRSARTENCDRFYCLLQQSSLTPNDCLNLIEELNRLPENQQVANMVTSVRLRYEQLYEDDGKIPSA